MKRRGFDSKNCKDNIRRRIETEEREEWQNERDERVISFKDLLSYEGKRTLKL